jgi:preprotein translocase subunit Sss1
VAVDPDSARILAMIGTVLIGVLIFGFVGFLIWLVEKMK